MNIVQLQLNLAYSICIWNRTPCSIRIIQCFVTAKRQIGKLFNAVVSYLLYGNKALFPIPVDAFNSNALFRWSVDFISLVASCIGLWGEPIPCPSHGHLT